MITTQQQLENLRIDISFTARYMNSISPKLSKYKELEDKLLKLRKQLKDLKVLHNQ